MIRIQITKSGLAAIGKNGFREVGRLAIEKAVRYWWEKYLPLHFTNIAHLRYGYKARDKRTNEMKRQRRPWPFGDDNTPAVGEVAPLVFTGRSRERALSSPNISAKAPNYQNYVGTAIINAPAFNFGAGKRIDMRAEVTALHPTEASMLEKIFGREWNRLLRAEGLRATRQTKVAA
jgi:hypothetical protein